MCQIRKDSLKRETKCETLVSSCRTVGKSVLLNPAVGPLGACGMINGRGYNLGYVQSSPQMVEDGSISIVYLNGDRCSSTSFYSTRIIFQCDDHPVSTTAPITVWRVKRNCAFISCEGKTVHVQPLIRLCEPQKSLTVLTFCFCLQGSPMFDRREGCEYVFIWRTSEACPVRKSQGESLGKQNACCFSHLIKQMMPWS